jgi:hypothetical protein
MRYQAQAIFSFSFSYKKENPSPEKLPQSHSSSMSFEAWPAVTFPLRPVTFPEQSSRQEFLNSMLLSYSFISSAFEQHIIIQNFAMRSLLTTNLWSKKDLVAI